MSHSRKNLTQFIMKSYLQQINTISYTLVKKTGVRFISDRCYHYMALFSTVQNHFIVYPHIHNTFTGTIYFVNPSFIYLAFIIINLYQSNLYYFTLKLDSTISVWVEV